MTVISKVKTSPCDGCGLPLFRPYDRDAALTERAQAKQNKEAWEGPDFNTTKDGVFILPFALYTGEKEDEYLVCTGRREHTPSKTCAMRAYGKKENCLTCGNTCWRDWPLPCTRCREDAGEGSSMRANATKDGEVLLTLVSAKIEGLYGKFGERDFDAVMSELFESFGARFGDSEAHQHLVLAGSSGYNDVRGFKVFLSRAQRKATLAVLEWLNVQVTRALKEAHTKGADLLGGIMRGEMTIDAMNEAAGRVAARYQKDEATIVAKADATLKKIDS